MVSIASLWLPILLSSIAVFAASSIIHMALKYHAADYKKLPDEEKITAAIRAAGVTPGTYHFPHCPDHKQMRTPEHMEKLKTGPIGLMTIIPSGSPNMGKYLACWFVYSLAIGVFVAYLAGRTLAPGTPYLQVFRIAGTVAFLCYGMAHSHASIWEGKAWSITFRFYLDALIYGCLTAGLFGWLWPK